MGMIRRREGEPPEVRDEVGGPRGGLRVHLDVLQSSAPARGDGLRRPVEFERRFVGYVVSTESGSGHYGVGGPGSTIVEDSSACYCTELVVEQCE